MPPPKIKKVRFDPKKHGKWNPNRHIDRRRKPPDYVGLLKTGKTRGRGKTKKTEIVPVNVFGLTDKRAANIKQKEKLVTQGLIGKTKKDGIIELWEDRRNKYPKRRKPKK